ncbi:MAG: SusC/RagA family TonB-linked outer membrane protein [Bacteroidales bacterium]|jgi:TonB-linked SusC/RagA family outer membrane protein
MRKFTIFFAFLLFAGMQSAFAQTEVKGSVTDAADGSPLPGVTIIVKGTLTGVITDAQGMYAINVPSGYNELVFSFVGMKTVEVKIDGRAVIDVQMSEDVFGLDEVVVTAIGVSREARGLGYAVQSVGSEDIARSPNINPVNSLSGRVAGVQITNSSGAAGASSYMTIRGAASLTGNNQPLFVIDGVPIDNSQLTSGNPLNGGNNLLYGVALSNRIVDINPEDIESINILKGGAATALYGLRAGNGAVIITTKKGTTGVGRKTTVSFNSSVTIEQVSQLPAMQDKYGQGLFGNLLANGTLSTTTLNWGPRLDTLRFDGGENPYYPNGNIVGMSNPNATDMRVGPYDNAGNFFQTGMAYNNSVSLTGGNQNTSYYFSIANTNSSGIVPNNTFARTSVSLAGESKLSKKFSTDARISYTNSGGDRIQQGSNTSGIMLALMRMPSNFDITGGVDDPVNDDASYRLPTGAQRNAYAGGGYDNPFWSVNMNRFNDKVNRVTGHASLNFLATDWLTFTYRVGTDLYSDRRKNYFSKGSRTFPAGQVYEEQHFVRDFNSDFLININKKINEDFTFTALLGQNMYQTQWQRLYVQGDNLAVPDFYNLNNAATIQAFETQIKKRTAALFADLGASFRNMLYANVTLRSEWSTSLPEAENPFLLYSGNLSFVFTELPGLKDNRILPFGKARVSYAEIANDAFTYATLSSYPQAAFGDGWTEGISFPGWGGVSASRLSTTIPNNELTPEILKSFEVGLDLRFFQNNRLGLDIAYYNNKSENLILQVPIAKSSGFYTANLNAGSMVNKGIELTLYGSPVRTSNFSWDIDINFTKNTNEVLELYEGVENVSLAGFVGAQARAVVGESYGSIFGDFFETNDDGDLIIDDDPESDNYGRPIYNTSEKNLGNVLPNWTMGILNSFSYKGISLSLLIDIKNGGVMWNGTRGAMYYFGTHADTESREDGEIYIFEGVKESDGSPNDIPIAKDIGWYVLGPGSGFTGPTSQFVEETDWVRLRELTLSYKLSDKIVNRTFFQSVEIFFTGRNLWVSTPYTGIDPETSLIGAQNGQGLDYFNMPGTKSYTFGLRLTL